MWRFCNNREGYGLDKNQRHNYSSLNLSCLWLSLQNNMTRKAQKALETISNDENITKCGNL